MMTVVGFASLMALLMTQQWLPLNPQAIANCSWHLAFRNTAKLEFCLQCRLAIPYSGESTMSYLSQTIGLSVHQFNISGASGFARCSWRWAARLSVPPLNPSVISGWI